MHTYIHVCIFEGASTPHGSPAQFWKLGPLFRHKGRQTNTPPSLETAPTGHPGIGHAPPRHRAKRLSSTGDQTQEGFLMSKANHNLGNCSWLRFFILQFHNHPAGRSSSVISR